MNEPLPLEPPAWLSRAYQWIRDPKQSPFAGAPVHVAETINDQQARLLRAEIIVLKLDD